MNPIDTQTQHVHSGDQSAEFADRRNQEGQAFDDNVNEHTVNNVFVNDVPKSAEVNELNRYATPENAQSRTINPDGSIPSTGSE